MYVNATHVIHSCAHRLCKTGLTLAFKQVCDWNYLEASRSIAELMSYMVILRLLIILETARGLTSTGWWLTYHFTYLLRSRLLDDSASPIILGSIGGHRPYRHQHSAKWTCMMLMTWSMRHILSWCMRLTAVGHVHSNNAAARHS